MTPSTIYGSQRSCYNEAQLYMYVSSTGHCCHLLVSKQLLYVRKGYRTIWHFSWLIFCQISWHVHCYSRREWKNTAVVRGCVNSVFPPPPTPLCTKSGPGKLVHRDNKGVKLSLLSELSTGGGGGGPPSKYLPYDLFQTITKMASRHQIKLLIVPIRCT